MQHPFYQACKRGDLAEVIHIYRNSTGLADNNFADAFIIACDEEQLAVMQWILNKRPWLNMGANNEYAFRYACYYGHLSVAQWLLEKRPDLEMGAENEAAFRKACINGHMEIAQWLLEKRPGLDIGAENEEAFRLARNSVATWLATTFPWRYVVNECGNRRVIPNLDRERLFREHMWRRRRDAVLAWKRGRLARLPADMAREIIEWM